MDLDTFMTTLYVVVDDLYTQEIGPSMTRHAGPPLKMSDSEVLTVAIAGQWRVGVPWQSERGVVRYMQAHGKHWFPGILQRSQFNQRVRQLWAALVRVQQLIGEELYTVDDGYESVDCLPLPHCSLAQAASHHAHWLSGHLGYGGNHGGWYFGEQLLLSVTARGVITGWMTGLAYVDDRWMMQAFVSARQGQVCLMEPPQIPSKRTADPKIPAPASFSPALAVGQTRGLPYLADEGFNGARWQTQWHTYFATTVITAPPDSVARPWSRAEKRWLSSRRQIIETVGAWLSEVFALHRLQAHSDWGKITRLAAITAAYNIGIFFNRMLNRPDGALATLIC